MLVVPGLLLVGLVVLVRLVLGLLTRTSDITTCPQASSTTPCTGTQATCRRKDQLEATDSEDDILDYLGDSTGPTSDDSS